LIQRRTRRVRAAVAAGGERFPDAGVQESPGIPLIAAVMIEKDKEPLLTGVLERCDKSPAERYW
jgi:hypothetical protein